KETSESPAERPSNPNQDGKPDDEGKPLLMRRHPKLIKKKEKQMMRNFFITTSFILLLLQEDTHAVHHTPSSPLSSLIALVIEENKNALSETETATQYFSLSEGEETQSSRKNQAEENLKDTTKHTTELVSTDVSKTHPLTQPLIQPLTQQTQHLQTSEGEQSDETPSEQKKISRILQNLLLS
ncbi:hypothetical protein HID58_062418, partial [Brassica napus]